VKREVDLYIFVIRLFADEDLIKYGLETGKRKLSSAIDAHTV